MKPLKPRFKAQSEQAKKGYMILPDEQGKPMMLRVDQIGAADNYNDQEVIKIYSPGGARHESRMSVLKFCDLYCAARNGLNVDYRTFQGSSGFAKPLPGASGIIVAPDGEKSIMLFPADEILSFKVRPDEDGTRVQTSWSSSSFVIVDFDTFEKLYKKALSGQHAVMWPEEWAPKAKRKKSREAEEVLSGPR